MLEIVISNRFKRDLKLAKKRGLDLNLLKEVVNRIAKREVLPENFRDHNLTGIYIGFRECHIKPDWLLVYKVEEEDLLLFLVRTGTHTDLFS